MTDMIWQQICMEAREKYGEDYMLRQLAEECLECAHAALKLIRARRGETPVSVEDATAKLVEEMADAAGMIVGARYTELKPVDMREYWTIMEEKQKRMAARLKGGGKDGKTNA